MKSYTLLVLLFVSTFAIAQNKAVKPVILIRGDGNVTVASDGSVVAGSSWAVGTNHTRVSKHDQTMEMAQDFLQFCPEFEATLDRASAPDYFVALNGEGGAYNIGQSQIMVLNRHKVVIFVAKKGTVKNAVKSTCNAIAADWQANGRLTAAGPPAVPAPVAAEAQAVPGAEPASHAAPASSPPAKPTTVALVLRATARAQQVCKPKTLADVESDTVAYLTAKGVALGTIVDSAYTLNLVVDRPMTKWIKITIHDRDSNGNVLWSEVVSDGGTMHRGTKGTLNALDKLHKIIDTKLGAQNGLPLLTAVQEQASVPPESKPAAPTVAATPANAPR